MTDNTDDLRAELDSLRERVNDLEAQIGNSGTNGSAVDSYDRYDRYVLDAVEDVTAAAPRRLMTLYDEAGIVDQRKKKQRTKRLRRLESE